MGKKRKSVPNRMVMKRPKADAASKGAAPKKSFKNAAKCAPAPPPLKGATVKPPQKQVVRPLNPFPARSSVLLLGEGDLSFSHLLAHTRRSLRPASITATTFDPLPEVLSKYPTSAPRHLAGLAAPPPNTTVNILHGIDATKLHSYRAVKKQRYDVVAMLFPHIGGKTKDRDRQIRANQVLLLGMFRGAAQVLEKGGRVAVTLFDGEVYEAWGIRGLARDAGLVGVTGGSFDPNVWVRGEEEEGEEENEEDIESDGESEFGFGQGLVDDEPKEVVEELKVEEEKVEAEGEEKAEGEGEEVTPPKLEYRHARTLGEIEGGGAWQGEKRSSRWYVFCRKGEEMLAGQVFGVGPSNKKKPKRKRGGDESSDDEEEQLGIVRSKAYKGLVNSGMDAGRAMLIRQLDG